MSRLSEAFRQAQQLAIAAKEEASRWSHPAVDVDHLLLGLLVTGGPAGDALRGCGVTLDSARAEVEAVHADHVAELGIAAPPLPARPILDAAVGDVDWTPRAMAVLSGIGDWSTDAAVLDVLVDEPSGLVGEVLDRLGVRPEDVRRALVQEVVTPVESSPVGSDGWVSLTHRGFVPAPLAQVWDLVSDPRRRPEWDTLVGRVERVTAEPADGEEAAEAWDLWAAQSRPDGKPARVPPRYRRSRLRQVAAQAPESVTWWVSQPDRGRRSGEQRLTVRLAEARGGTRVEMVAQWRRRRGGLGVLQRTAEPARRFVARQNLIVQLAGISRRLR